jgi:hypothetical protein
VSAATNQSPASRQLLVCQRHKRDADPARAAKAAVMMEGLTHQTFNLWRCRCCGGFHIGRASNAKGQRLTRCPFPTQGVKMTTNNPKVLPAAESGKSQPATNFTLADLQQMEVSRIAELFPHLDATRYAIVKQSVETQGQVNPILVWRNSVVDGRSRIKILTELKRKPLVEVIPDETPEQDVIARVMVDNAMGKPPLTTSQRHAQVAKLIEIFANRSDRFIAQMTGMSPTSIGSIRKEIEPAKKGVSSSGQVKRTGKDGKGYTVKPKPSQAAAAKLSAASNAVSFSKGDRVWVEYPRDGDWTEVTIVTVPKGGPGAHYTIQLPAGNVMTLPYRKLRLHKPTTGEAVTPAPAQPLKASQAVQASLPVDDAVQVRTYTADEVLAPPKDTGDPADRYAWILVGLALNLKRETEELCPQHLRGEAALIVQSLEAMANKLGVNSKVSAADLADAIVVN